jgi:hypothetical protein
VKLYPEAPVAILDLASGHMTGQGDDPLGVFASTTKGGQLKASHDGRHLYVNSQIGVVIGVIDTTTNTVVSHIDAQGGVLAVSPDDQTLYLLGNDLQVIDLTTSAVRTVSPPFSILASAISDDGAHLYLGGISGSSTTTPHLAVMDTSSLSVSEIDYPGGVGPVGLLVVGNKLYVNNDEHGGCAFQNTRENAGHVLVYDIGSPTGASLLPLSRFPESLPQP